MEIREYERLASRELTYFWHIGRREILAEALDRHRVGQKNAVLDIGCGTGGNIHLLRSFGRVTGIDAHEEALRFARTRGFADLFQGDATKLPCPDGSFDLAAVLDVLEHIVDDKAAIREAFRVLRPGGYFIVTVPSYQWLYSQHDKALHHVRRYSRLELTAKVEAGGFEIVERTSFSTAALMVNTLRMLRDRLFNKEDKTPEAYDVVFGHFLNAVLLSTFRMEKFIIRFLPLPVGTSLMVLARKPAA